MRQKWPKKWNSTNCFSLMTTHLILLCLCTNCWPKTKWLSTPSLLTRLSTMWWLLLQKLKMMLKGEKFNTTIIQAQQQDAPVEFQTMHVIKCFEQWCDQRVYYTKSQADYFKGTKTDEKASVVVTEKQIQIENYLIAPYILPLIFSLCVLFPHPFHKHLLQSPHCIRYIPQPG